MFLRRYLDRKSSHKILSLLVLLERQRHRKHAHTHGPLQACAPACMHHTTCGCKGFSSMKQHTAAMVPATVMGNHMAWLLFRGQILDFHIILVPKGCHNKVPQSRWLKTTGIYSHSSGDYQSDMKASAGPCCL